MYTGACDAAAAAAAAAAAPPVVPPPPPPLAAAAAAAAGPPPPPPPVVPPPPPPVAAAAAAGRAAAAAGRAAAGRAAAGRAAGRAAGARAREQAARHAADREERCGGVDRGEGRVLADRVGLDLEVEVHPDLLEEVVLHRDEPDLDRDLEVLQSPELAEQVGHLVVDLRRVADDQADAEEERRDGTGRTRLDVVLRRRRTPRPARTTG